MASATGIVELTDFVGGGAGIGVDEGDAKPVEAVAQFGGGKLVDFGEPWFIVIGIADLAAQLFSSSIVIVRVFLLKILAIGV